MVNSSGGVGEPGLTGLVERMYQTFIETLGLNDQETDAPCSKQLITQG
jgi:hypothetical protein